MTFGPAGEIASNQRSDLFWAAHGRFDILGGQFGLDVRLGQLCDERVGKSIDLPAHHSEGAARLDVMNDMFGRSDAHLDPAVLQRLGHRVDAAQVDDFDIKSNVGVRPFRGGRPVADIKKGVVDDPDANACVHIATSLGCGTSRAGSLGLT